MLVVAVASFHSCAFGTSYCAGGFGSQLWGSIHLYEGFCFVERGISTTPRACFGFYRCCCASCQQNPGRKQDIAHSAACSQKPAQAWNGMSMCPLSPAVNAAVMAELTKRLAAAAAGTAALVGCSDAVRTKDFNIESDGEGQDLGLLEVCYLLFVMFVINRGAVYAERRRLNHGGAVGALPVPRRIPRFLQWTCLQQFQPGENL